MARLAPLDELPARAGLAWGPNRYQGTACTA
eukprot:CAMPEP_0195083244 /NCGR_PEP_ID=MMETSP0448-20130528/24233_1 /TAXON_ID=66468 /ORGANISM="Heterocapsa triquestra, Strain CCMP 448" /LENGTH=30 /DNA_ID= /DNA_START= /DNA_END= /DNA_ORIENTATION=